MSKLLLKRVINTSLIIFQNETLQANLISNIGCPFAGRGYMKLTITGYSTALFATWYFIEELDILFDAGDGVIAGLLQKSRKVKHVFLSHADRDHLTGLLQLNQLNARPQLPVMYYPKDARSFKAFETFTKQFDKQVAQTVWQPVQPGDRLPVKGGMYYVEPLRNGHVVTDSSLIKSLGYKVFQTKRKLKPEFASLSEDEIRQLSFERGKENISEEVSRCLLAYSGDTPVEDPERWNGCETLIHEATFLGDGDDIKLRTHGNQHSNVEDVIDMVSRLQIDNLVLGHFSSRYTSEQIRKRVTELCNKYALQTKVYLVLPGERVADVLNGKPINQ